MTATARRVSTIDPTPHVRATGAPSTPAPGPRQPSATTERDGRPGGFHSVLAPVVGAGALLGTYLVARPYGDADGATTWQAARAFASNQWVVAHLCGALGLASVGRLALRLNDVAPSPLGRGARWCGLLGTVLVLPYYGAETFALHLIGGRALRDGNLGLLDLVDAIRNQPAALATFGGGLLLLAVAGVLIALRWQRSAPTMRWAAWPLGLLVALVLPQFYLAPALRIGFGVLVAAAATLLAVAVVRSERANPEHP